MFTLTKKTDYAIIALSHMAQHPGHVCTAREIAEKFGIPLAVLMNILKTMSQQELVRSLRGARGGYTLMGTANELSLAAIIEAIEGPIRFTQCQDTRPGESACDLYGKCPVQRPAQKINEKLKQLLETITLADIANDSDLQACVPLSVEGAAVRSTQAVQ